MPTRRAVLRRGGAVGLGLLALPVLNACGHVQHDVSPTPDAKRIPSGGGAADQVLLAHYAAALEAHPSLAPFVAIPMAHHRTHAATLGSEAVPAGSVAAAPADPVATVQGLITLEQKAATARVAQAVANTAKGSVLAAIAASESVHALLLTAELPAIRAQAAASASASADASEQSTQPDGQTTAATDPGRVTSTAPDDTTTQSQGPTGNRAPSTPSHHHSNSASSQPTTPGSTSSTPASPTQSPSPTPTPTPTPSPTDSPTPSDSTTPTPTDSDTSDPLPSITISLSLPPLPTFSPTIPDLGFF